MPSSIDIAQGLDKIAAKLSVFSISPEPAIMAAQMIRDLSMRLSVAEKQLDDAVRNTASYFERPAQAPRRAIQGVEIETMSSSRGYRVRFGETVLSSDLEGVDSSVLFGSLVSEFARQLAARLGVQAEFDFNADDGSLSILGIVSTRSAFMAMTMSSYGYDVRPAVPMAPPRVEYDTDDDPEDDDYEDDEEPFECTCMVCSEARASEARVMAEEEAAAAAQRRENDMAAIRRAVTNPWRPVGRYAEALQTMIEQGLRVPIMAPPASEDAQQAAAEEAATHQRIEDDRAAMQAAWMSTLQQEWRGTDQVQYAEPESERAISESDENHWRTRGV